MYVHADVNDMLMIMIASVLFLLHCWITYECSSNCQVDFSYYEGETGQDRDIGMSSQRRKLYMSGFLPTWGVRAFAFQEESEDGRKANQKVVFFFLIQALLRRLFSSRKIRVSFTLALQSLETPLQTMWQHQLNSQLSWGRDTPA